MRWASKGHNPDNYPAGYFLARQLHSSCEHVSYEMYRQMGLADEPECGAVVDDDQDN